ncbi:MAG: raqprd family integrative conjugative element protein [Porticoccus sp.]|jgi:RAQPRD family integrative conjugative element protein|uniref:integrative conjugative element protein, RAQPRD family n=1 Tax=Porticoccus hydrocarbonoclasticus TaxID=1073414 RepID=UPI000C53F606|nr:RAQPRD family integrative conjugative element protein [Porticoccus hydrocarbonoclasticus]MBG58784.1 raqprd family integrative conjugative element protein [Porticoccus sp.]|tara:strand:- start:2112 stop:2462 length:351 start_codon:yes stop_codon:yes gene_type:complete
MSYYRRRINTWKRSIAAPLAIAFLSFEPALAGENPTENAQLAAVIRQLDMIDRLAEHSASPPRQDSNRYYFDYERLHKDIERVRQGVRDYLAPKRAQPRDPLELLGQFRQTNETDQ